MNRMLISHGRQNKRLEVSKAGERAAYGAARPHIKNFLERIEQWKQTQ